MRLSTESSGDEDAAEPGSIAVLHAALDAGISFLDSADVYCRDDRDIGCNERLIARALDCWRGDRSRITVATKGGLTRPQGRWVPDGRARHLASACEASCRALGVGRIALYQLHAPDPRVPLATSVRALAALQRDGLVDAIGLCNVNVGQIEEARRIVSIASVQAEINPWNDNAFLSGVAEYCAANGIRLIAYRPLGGVARMRRALKEPLFVDLAARHHASPQEIALAWLSDLTPHITTIPGATRVETAQSVARAAAVRLSDDDRARLDARFPAAATMRGSRPAAPQHVSNREVVLIMGLPGAGKTTLARSLESDGCTRLNRDEAGGSLRDLIPSLERALDSGAGRIILDNTYGTRKARAPVLAAAAKVGAAVRCVWLTTSVEDAQINAVERIWDKYGRLLEPEEMRRLIKEDVAAFGPGAQFRQQREFEPPDAAEGFARIDPVVFERRRDPSRTGRAVIVWCDDAVVTRAAAEVRRRADAGWRILGMGWRPEPGASFDAIRERLGVPVDIQYCPHPAGPPICWCRKPLPGLGVMFIRRYQLDPSQCVYIGSGSLDATFARRLGFDFLNVAGSFV